jgi:predicted nucleic acid-binding protein
MVDHVIHVIHISESDAASNFADVLAKVRAGAEVVIESGKLPMAVLRPLEPPVRLRSGSLPSCPRTRFYGHARRGIRQGSRSSYRKPSRTVEPARIGLLVASSVVIAAERRGETVEQLIARIIKPTGDQEAALSAIGLTELIHGICRAQTPEIRRRRESFIHERMAVLIVYPCTEETALLAGKIDGEEQKRGVVIPFGDLLVGATA